MSEPDPTMRAEESRAAHDDARGDPDESLLVGARMTFRERLEWNEAMVSLWARWHPDLARRVWIDREPIR